MITVKVLGMAAITDHLRALPKELHGQAIGPALNRTAEKARAEIARALPQEYAVKAAEVRSAISLRKASGEKLSAVVEIFGSAKKRGRSLNLIHFLAAVQSAGKAYRTRGARGNRKALAALDSQIGFLIKKAGGLKKIEGAFIGNKGRTIFRRIGKARLPIEPLQVIGFSQMFASRRMSSRVMAKINADLPVEIERAIARVLARSGA